jgi:hypothetical protein
MPVAANVLPSRPIEFAISPQRRAVFVALSAFDRMELELDVMGHPLLNVLYYSLVEILPSACVLFILRKLPPKRTAQQGYQQVR